ncbi:MAG: Maf family nucleotide pyrophosphatase [Prolixibacteraceae bacterium]|jgi:septum formation protein|nr:Maf family nucleotide pyrophosphatase [Prolixibacteraceae bacterium]
MNLLPDLTKYSIILASKSPRRQQLLSDLGLTFDPMETGADESFPDDMPVEKVAAFLAEKKADALLPELKGNQLVITADTIVVLEGKILNKPDDAAHARGMLQSLSGKKHEVITGVCLRSNEKKVVFSVATKVWFKKLSDEEIDFYIENCKPFDKAGAYGIQEWIGYVGIYRIDGSYFNVMGLPVQQLYTHLATF